MTISQTRALTALSNLFRSLPADVVKSTIEDIEDEHTSTGTDSIQASEIPTGPAYAAHGGQATHMVSAHSDLTAQRGRQAEYEGPVAGLMADIKKALDVLVAQKAAPAAKPGAEESYLTVVEKSLKKAKSAIFKAETSDDEDEEKKDTVEKAERLLAKAARLLAKAQDEEDDEDEDEDRIEKARASLKAITKSLKPLKDEFVAKAAAAAAAEVAKATADAAVVTAAPVVAEPVAAAPVEKSELDATVTGLQGQLGLVTKSVNDVLEMVAGMSRTSAQPPVFTKATAPVAEVDFATRAQEAADADRISGDELMKCHGIMSRLALVKGGAAGPGLSAEAIKSEIAAASPGVREVFTSLIA